ncbi:MAG: hypothetical protein ABFS56_22615 [Pseudomonadota bacterium]
MRYYFKIISVFFILTLQGCVEFFVVPVVSPEKATLDVSLNGVWDTVSGDEKGCKYMSFIPFDRKAHLLKCFDGKKRNDLMFKVSCTLINEQKYCSFRLLHEELLMEYVDKNENAPKNEKDSLFLKKLKQEGTAPFYLIFKITKIKDTLLLQPLEANNNEIQKITTIQALHKFIISNQERFSKQMVYKKLDKLPKIMSLDN